MIALAIAALIQSDQARIGSFVERARPQTSVLQEASAAWNRCLEQAADKYMVSSEPADVVASAAMWECQRHKVVVFDAAVALRIATLPNLSEQEVRRQLLTDPMISDPTGENGRRDRTVYLVVTKRMGLPAIPPAWSEPLR